MYHHIQELVPDKKLEVWKVDNEANIADSLMKKSLDQCFGTLRGLMGLQQASAWRGAERKESEGKSKIGPTRQVKMMKEPNNWKATDATDCKATERTKDDLRTSGAENRS